MTTLNLSNAVVSNMSTLPDWRIPSADTDSPKDQEQEEYEWENKNWKEQWGLFNAVSELQNATLMKAIWDVGKGWTADTYTKIKIERFSGWGKDTFDDIMLNMDVISMVAGDAYAEVIRDETTQDIINLKPINPGTIKHIVGKNGRLIRYEQWNGDKKKTFKPNEIFHLSYNRLADQIHGISKIDSMREIILADQKSFEIMQKVMKHQAVPFILWKLKTDDTTKINAFVSKVRSVREKYEDLFIPDDENIATWEVITLNPSQLILEWRTDLRNKFYRAFGLPQIVPGGGERGTGSESRTIYLAFEQLVAQRQLYLQNQIWFQLGLKLRFNPPTTMADLIGTSESKTAGGFQAQPSEVNPSADKQ